MVGLRAATTGGKRRVDLRVDSRGLVPRGVALGFWPAVGIAVEVTNPLLLPSLPTSQVGLVVRHSLPIHVSDPFDAVDESTVLRLGI